MFSFGERWERTYMTKNLDWIKQMENQSLQLREMNPHYYHSSVQNYLSFYQIDISKLDEYRCGYEIVKNRKIFFQFFIKKGANKTVLLVHGYLDHSGGLSRTINYLLSQNFHVMTVDLPGHGFSEGEEGGISSFRSYISPIETAYELICHYLKESNVHGVGHSTGGAMIFHATAEKRIDVKNLVLVAPLYYPYKWDVVKRSKQVLEKNLSDKKRLFRKNSSDELYCKFIKNDPLQGRILKVDWLKALEDWQKEFYHCDKVDLPVYILQGTRDTTVEWKKNLCFYESKCEKMQTALFEGGRHQLLNERVGVRKLVFNRLCSFLKKDDEISLMQIKSS